MFRQSQRKISGILNHLLGEPSKDFSGQSPRKPNRSLRTGRKLRAEQLEARNLFAGLSFESVITTESNWPDGKSYGFTVAADAVGNTYMGGFFQGIADFDRNAVYPGNLDILTARGTGDAFLAKYSPSGQFLWARRMGGDSTTNVFGNDEVKSISIDNSGNVLLTGVFEANADFGSDLLMSAGLQDSFLAKVDPNGNFMWTKHWGTAATDSSNTVVVDGNGNASVLSSLNRDVNLPGLFSSEIRQFDANGNPSWITEVATGRLYNSLINDANGDLYVAGTFRGTVDLDPGPGQTIVTSLGTTRNSFISKISTSGTLEWATRFVADTSLDATSYVNASRITVGNDGSIAVLGEYQGDVRIGEGVNALSLPSNQTARSFFATLDPSTGTRNVVRVYDGKFTDYSHSLIATKDGYTATSETVPNNGFNPVPGISLASKGERDIWIMTFDQTGSISWAGLVGGESVDVVYQSSSDGKGGVLITGSSASTVFDFDPNPNRVYAVSSPGSFVLKLKPTLATKFYVVDDASINRTYEYSADSSSVDEYSLNSGNMTPRGAASTVAGDKVWVVDANKKVYVYNDSGILLGSWTAGSVASNATIEGIATNGTDVWLVDARQDRVYRYANAASRLSGSQNATSNFALNSGNTSPKDIVTDGTNLWVVNDSSTDRVFKYTLTGSLVGSWTIDSGNKAPTGLTIDPSGASQSIWIVDNGTDRVYEYTNSRSRNADSQSASLSFALASGNTNPQGIADPPAPTSAGPTTVASTIDKSNGNKITSDKNGLNVQMLEGSFPTVSSDSRDSKLARRFDPPREAISNGMVRDTAAVDSSTYVVPFFSSRSASPTASLAAIDEAFSSPDSLLDDDQHESLWSLGKTSIKGRRLR